MRKVEEIIRNKIEQVLNQKFITCKNSNIFKYDYLDSYVTRKCLLSLPHKNFDFNEMSRN